MNETEICSFSRLERGVSSFNANTFYISRLCLPKAIEVKHDHSFSVIIGKSIKGKSISPSNKNVPKISLFIQAFYIIYVLTL